MNLWTWSFDAMRTFTAAAPSKGPSLIWSLVRASNRLANFIRPPFIYGVAKIDLDIYFTVARRFYDWPIFALRISEIGASEIGLSGHPNLGFIYGLMPKKRH